MANDYVLVDEYFQGTCEGTKSSEFGMGCVEANRDDFDNENERVPSASMDVLLRFHWNTVQSDRLRKIVHKVNRHSSKEDKWIDNSCFQNV